MLAGHSHDSIESYFHNKSVPELICAVCKAEVKRYIHHGAGGWVPTWSCPKHGDVIPVEKRGFKS